MDSVISLSSPNLDWELLALRVERADHPVWLELGGVIRGVLLPPDAARRLMGQYVQAHVVRRMNHLAPAICLNEILP